MGNGTTHQRKDVEELKAFWRGELVYLGLEPFQLEGILGECFPGLLRINLLEDVLDPETPLTALDLRRKIPELFNLRSSLDRAKYPGRSMRKLGYRAHLEKELRQLIHHNLDSFCNSLENAIIYYLIEQGTWSEGDGSPRVIRSRPGAQHEKGEQVGQTSTDWKEHKGEKNGGATRRGRRPNPLIQKRKGIVREIMSTPADFQEPKRVRALFEQLDLKQIPLPKWQGPVRRWQPQEWTKLLEKPGSPEYRRRITLLKRGLYPQKKGQN